LIISTSLDEQQKIEEVVQHHSPGSLAIETTASFGQDITYWTTQAPDVLVIQMPEDESLQSYFFTKLRKDVPFSQPIVILCPVISTQLMQLSQEYSKLRNLKSPIDGFVLYRTLNDLTHEYAEGQRQIHPRYLTDQTIELHSDYHNGKLLAQMKNLSLSGAYFESLALEFELKIGDFIKMSIMAGEPSKQYVFDVKIVWTKPLASGGFGFGATFVNKEEVYNHLLKNI
jgi:hypothetical protein